MSAELARNLTLDQERPSFGGNRPEPDQFQPREPVLFWDKIAQRWPKERFPSFISYQVTIEVQSW
jgi:hypothetical protein